MKMVFLVLLLYTAESEIFVGYLQCIKMLKLAVIHGNLLCIRTL